MPLPFPPPHPIWNLYTPPKPPISGIVPDPTPEPSTPVTWESFPQHASTDRMLNKIDRELAAPIPLPIMCPAIIPGVGTQFYEDTDVCGLNRCWEEQWAGTSWCEKHLLELRGES